MRGSSAGAVWEISADYPEARLTVGSDPSAGWSIQAAGVQPMHCELFWDGTALWVADTHGAGGVFLDGQRVSEWTQIHGPAELRFGAASMDIETSPPVHEQMASRPDHARPATVTDLLAPPERGSQPIFGGAAGDESIPELDAAATRVVASPVLPPAAPPASPPSGGGAMSDLRPRLGGQATAVSAEATRMVAMPVARPAAPARPPAPPERGPAAVVAPPPPAPPSLAAPAPVAPPMPPPDPGHAFAPPAAPDGGPAFAPPPAVPAPATKPSPFAQILQKLKPESSAEVVGASGGKKGQALPTRTWIMLAVTVMATAGLLLWPEEEAEVAAPSPASAAVAPSAAPEPAVAAPTPTAPTPADPTPADPAEPVPDPTAAAAATPAPSPAPSSPAPAASQTGAAADAPATSLQRQAADHYIAGRFSEALVIYRQLAQSEPTNPAYTGMVRILERRTRCRDGVGPGGAPCVEH